MNDDSLNASLLTSNARLSLKKNLDPVPSQLMHDTMPLLLDEDTHISDVQISVGIHMPPRLELLSIGDSLRDASYKVDGKRGTRTKHSESMDRVLNSVEAMDVFLDMPVVLEEEAFAGQFAAMEDRYHHLIMDCNSYIESHHPHFAEGKKRLEMVTKIRDLAANELQHLKSSADAFREKAAPETEATWRDIAGTLRVEKYVQGVDGVEISRTGGSASTVHVIKKGDHTTFFKEREKRAQGTFSDGMTRYLAQQQELSLRLNDPNDAEFAQLTPAEKEKLSRDTKRKLEVAEDMGRYLVKQQHNGGLDPAELLHQILIGNMQELNTLDKRYPGLKQTLFFKELNKVASRYIVHRQRIDQFQQAADELKQRRERNNPDPAEEERVRRELKRLKDDTSLLDLSINVLKEIHKIIHSGLVAAQGPEIGSNGELSTRNVAVSRLAELLGIKDCVVDCHMAQIELHGKVVDGLAMEQAKGTDMGVILTVHEGKKGQYSANAARQLLDLQVLDVLCGQTDRHPGNYMAETTFDGSTYKVTGITGIDNDMCLGEMQYSRIKKQKTVGFLTSIENGQGMLKLPAMSDELANRILALEPRMLDYLMGDILNARELGALKGRLAGVQSAIRKKKDAEEQLRKENQPFHSVFLQNPQDWEAFLARAAADPEAASEGTYLQKELLQH